MSIPTKLPSAVVSDILSTVRASHEHAIRQIYSQVSGTGAFTSQSCEITLEQAKFAMMSGHAMRQMADCWIADQLASKFRNEVMRMDLSDNDGRYSSAKIPDLFDSSPPSGTDPLSKLHFLQAYDLGIDAMHRNTDTDDRKTTFFDTLVSANNADQGPTPWETVQQAFLHSSRPRALINQGYEESLKELSQELSVTLLGAWPDLPEELNEEAKSMTTRVLAGKSGTA